MNTKQNLSNGQSYLSSKNPALIWQVLSSSVKRVLCTKKPVSLYHNKMELDTPGFVMGKLLVQSHQPEWLSWHSMQDYQVRSI
jgi:hypothetical protein